MHLFDENRPTATALTIAQAAEALTVSISTMKALIAKGSVRVVRLGRRVIVPASEIARLLAE